MINSHCIICTICQNNIILQTLYIVTEYRPKCTVVVVKNYNNQYFRTFSLREAFQVPIFICFYMAVIEFRVQHSKEFNNRFRFGVK